MNFPNPTAAQLALPGRSTQVRAYQRASWVTVSDVGRVRPTLLACMKAIRTGKGQPVTAGNYETEEMLRLKDAAEALKQERFRAFCEQDGHDGKKRALQRCDVCHELEEGWLFYQPNAMGYPTPVLFQCDCCGGE